MTIDVSKKSGKRSSPARLAGKDNTFATGIIDELDVLQKSGKASSSTRQAGESNASATGLMPCRRKPGMKDLLRAMLQVSDEEMAHLYDVDPAVKERIEEDFRILGSALRKVAAELVARAFWGPVFLPLQSDKRLPFAAPLTDQATYGTHYAWHVTYEMLLLEHDVVSREEEEVFETHFLDYPAHTHATMLLLEERLTGRQADRNTSPLPGGRQPLSNPSAPKLRCMALPYPAKSEETAAEAVLRPHLLPEV